MRFDIAFVFAILGAAVEALPLTGSNTDFTTSNIATAEKRQLDQTTTTTKNNDVVTVSKSQGTTHDNIGYSWKPKTDNNSILERRQLAKGTGTTTVNQGGYTITTSNTQGTTGDKKGFRWEPESSSILRRQDTQVVRDGENDVIVSKSQGTTGDRTGFSWRRAGLL